MRRLTDVLAWCAFALNLFIFSTAALAEKRLALVIGNGAYKESAALSNTRNDALDLVSSLRRLDFDVMQGVDLDKRAMERLIREFDRKLSGADIALFFYAGHGLQVSGQNYLIPVDARLVAENDVDFESVPLDLILRRMERQAKTSVVLLDACRDNPLARNLAGKMGTRGGHVGQGLSRVESGIGTLIGFSTQPGNTALDGDGRNSPYSAALLDEIERPGRDLLATLAAVRGKVVKATEGKQVPWEHTSLLGPVVLKGSPERDLGARPAGTVSPSSFVGEAAQTWQLIEGLQDISLLEAFRKQFGEANPVYGQLAAKRIASLRQAQAEEEQRLAAQKAEAERKRAQAEQERLAALKAEEDKKQAEAKRLADERAAGEAERARKAEDARKQAEAKRLADEKAAEAERTRKAEEARKQAEARRLAEEKAAAEAKRFAEEKAAAETKRLAEETRNQAETKRLADEKAAAEAERVRKAEEARKQAEAKKLAEEHASAESKKLIEETRKQAEARRLAEEKAAVEAERVRKAEEARKQAEARRLAEEKAAAAESKRLAEEKAAAEAKRLADEARKQAEAKRLAEEARKQAEAKRLAEERAAAEAKRVAEEKAAAEAKRLADEARKQAEAKRLAELKSTADEASTAEKIRLAALGSQPSTPATPEVNSERQVRAAQAELQRIGCYSGPSDGRLSEATRDAIQQFFSKAKRTQAKIEITDDFVSDLKRQQRVCPLVCSEGKIASGDRCIAAKPKPEKPVQRQRAREEEPRQARPPANRGGGGSSTMTGVGF